MSALAAVFARRLDGPGVPWARVLRFQAVGVLVVAAVLWGGSSRWWGASFALVVAVKIVGAVVLALVLLLLEPRLMRVMEGMLGVSLGARLKRVDVLRRPIKRWKVVREYVADARFMNRHLLDGGTSTEHQDYRILLLVHSLEKGLSYRSPRAFGAAKALRLTALLEGTSGAPALRTAYSMGLGALSAWLAFHDARDEGDPETRERVRRLLSTRTVAFGLLEPAPAGARAVSASADRWDGLPIDEFLQARHSVRHYAAEPVDDRTLDECVQLAMTSPSACNRQMVRLRMMDSPELKRLLYDTLHGTGGIDFETCRLGVVTFDVKSWEFYGERNQGYLNAGLFAMTLVHALQWRGVGSCLLQFGNTFSEERHLVRALGIPDSERIAVGISLGRVETDDTVPASVRRPVVEVWNGA
jgi:nitroreductase